MTTERPIPPDIKEIVERREQVISRMYRAPSAPTMDAVTTWSMDAEAALLSLAAEREDAVDIGDANEAEMRKVANERLARAIKAEAERDEARRERDELRLEILGGEDVPGVAATVPVRSAIGMLQEERFIQTDRAERAEKQLAEAVGVLRAAQRAMEPALKGYRRSDEEDDWRECVVCHGWIDHYGHSPGCALVAADVGLRAFLAQHKAPAQ